MQYEQPLTFAVKHKNENIRSMSRSGGIFTALSDAVLQRNGAVYGCILTDKFEAIHIRADNYSERDQMRGSKYIQSKTTNTFQQVLQDLIAGRTVLYSGTSCQIAGLKRFLEIKIRNKNVSTPGVLLCVDVVCHGVPSPKTFTDYIHWLEKKKKCKVINVDFRNKNDFGWKEHIETLTFRKFGMKRKYHSNMFRRMFYQHNVLRPACYECPYKSVLHPSDITIADYWGIQKAAPGFDDNRGVSLVLVNNDRGKSWFDLICDNIVYQQTKLEVSMQRPLIAPYERPAQRDQFWQDYWEKGMDYIARNYLNDRGFRMLRNRLGILWKWIRFKFHVT